jgi:hypothetical protein
MKLKQAIEIIENHKKWINGENKNYLFIIEINQAIDTILESLKERFTKQDFLDAAKNNQVSMLDAVIVVKLLDEIKNK